jgi:hypothetical protein
MGKSSKGEWYPASNGVYNVTNVRNPLADTWQISGRNTLQPEPVLIAEAHLRFRLSLV